MNVHAYVHQSKQQFIDTCTCTCSFELHAIRSFSLKLWQICVPVGVKQNDLLVIFVFLFFEMRGVTNHLYVMTGPAGNSEFSFPLSFTMRVSGEKNSLFPLGSLIKCLLNNNPADKIFGTHLVVQVPSLHAAFGFLFLF